MDYPPIKSNGFIVADAFVVAVEALAVAALADACADVTKAEISAPCR
jgi:hypothetical protein